MIVTTNGKPDDLMAVASSYDQTLRYGAQTPFSDQLGIHMEGVQWEVDSTHDSLIAIGNGSAKPVKAIFTTFYNHGLNQYILERTLQPDEQMWLDLGQIIRMRMPDSKGQTLPLDLTSGTYQLMEEDAIGNASLGSLYEGKVIVDKTFGHAAYGCVICCGFNADGYMSPDPFSVVETFSGPIHATGTDGCNGSAVVLDPYMTSWTSDDTSIATASYAQGTGVNPGSPPNLWSSGYIHQAGIRHCPNYLVQNEGPTTVVPCPSYAGVARVTQETLANVVSTYKTGIGAATTMLVGPQGTTYNGAQITEALSQNSNTCPSTWNNGNLCTSSGAPFVVGDGPYELVDGSIIQPQTNVFIDEHNVLSSVSLLDYSNITSCSATCSQQYSCNGHVIGGTFTITFTFSKSTIQGTPVTITTANKQ